MGRRTVVLLVALALAAMSAVAIWAFLERAEDDAREGLVEVPVYRAIEFIPRGAQGDVSLELFEESAELDGFLPATAIQTRAQLEATLRGRISLGPISAGQIVTGDLWGDPALEVVGLADLIEEGFQAISIRPDEVRGVGGFVRPGDRVNMIASTEVELELIRSALRTPAARSVFFPGLQARLGLSDEEMLSLAEALPETRKFTEFVLQDLLVLAVGNRTTPAAPVADADGTSDVVGAQIITLQVLPADAERLVYVQDFMTSWLTLVPPGFEPVETQGAELEDVVDLPEQLINELRGLGFLAAPGS